MVHKEKIDLPGNVGTLELTFTPRSFQTDEETRAARAAVLSAVHHAFITTPSLARFAEASRNYAHVRDEGRKAAADLEAARARLDDPEVCGDSDRYFKTTVEVDRLERASASFANRLATLAAVLKSGRADAVLTTKRKANAAVEPAPVENGEAFMAVCRAAQAAAGALKAEPGRPLFRELDPDSEAERAVNAMLPPELRNGYSPPPPPERRATELPPIDPQTGVVPVRPNTDTITRHSWHRGPGERIVPNDLRPEDYALTPTPSLRPGGR